MSRIIDARGLPCPQPVLKTKQAMEEVNDVLTIVDSPNQAENVSRMARKAGWAVDVDGKEDGIYVRVSHQDAAQEPEIIPDVVACKSESSVPARPLVLIVPSEHMGRGDSEELGTVLVRAFFHTLLEMDNCPDTIVFFNSGVKLVAEGSPLVEDLQALAGRGVEVLACGTCLGYYELMDKLAVGTISNMYTIAETILGTARVVSL